MSEHISNRDFVELMQEAFSRGQQISFVPTGRSMLPMLDGVEDTVTFEKKPEKLKKYDVVFYCRASGQLVLHRLIGFEKNGGYIFCGDGQYHYEYGITDDDVLALMVAYTHKGKERSIDTVSYRLYICCMMLKKHIFRLMIKVYHLLKGKKLDRS